MTTLVIAFSASCEEAAQWRERVHQLHGDERNLRCANALRAAAKWATSAHDAEVRLRDLLPEQPAGASRLQLNERETKAFRAYCFHGPEGLERWLGRVAYAQYDELDDTDEGRP